MTIDGCSGGLAGSYSYRIGRVDSETMVVATLQTAAAACRRIDIGTAVLPKPLFCADVEDSNACDPTAAEDIAADMSDT